MSPGPRTRLPLLARAALFAWLSLAAPSVHEVLVDVGAWLDEDGCCPDGCDDDAPGGCPAQCARCVSAPHHLTAVTVQPATPLGIVSARCRRLLAVRGRERPGHLEPPFRPPAR